ncbi:hypothetical protein V6U89_26890 [Micromonospora sp. CPCC 206171]|uniref:hypothetical protein n=1 Tax=Micromonospora sp. CPCC 206171 TaxID=3122405 RepID=UPI002FF06DDA
MNHELERRWANNGNLVLSHAAHKLLSTTTAEITPTEFKVNPREADEIDEKYDVYVVPLANAFRRSYAYRIQLMTRLVERLKIPVVVPAVRPATATSPEALLERIQWLRDRNTALDGQVRTLEQQRLRARARRAVGAPVRRILSR